MFFLLALLFLPVEPNQAVTLLQHGLVALQQGQTQQARADLEQASRFDSKNPYIWSSLAEVYLHLQEPKLASSAADQAATLGGTNPIVCHALAMYYSEAGQPARAAEFEERFAESTKADPDAMARAATLYLDSDDKEKALPLAQKAQQQHPSAPTEYLLARALLANGKPDDAAGHLHTAWQTDPHDSQIAFDWGQLLLRKGDATGAADAFETALTAHPDDAQLTLALGVARYGQRRFDEAISIFLKVIGIDPGIEQPYLFLGRMLDQANTRLPEITKDYETWLARDPGNAKASSLLAKARLAADGSDQTAESLLRNSIRLAPDNWESHYELGVLLETKQQYKEACNELVRGVELDPKQAMSHYHLARVYARLGEPERAKAEREIHQKLTTQKGQ